MIRTKKQFIHLVRVRLPRGLSSLYCTQRHPSALLSTTSRLHAPVTQLLQVRTCSFPQAEDIFHFCYSIEIWVKKVPVLRENRTLDISYLRPAFSSHSIYHSFSHHIREIILIWIKPRMQTKNAGWTSWLWPACLYTSEHLCVTCRETFHPSSQNWTLSWEMLCNLQKRKSVTEKQHLYPLSFLVFWNFSRHISWLRAVQTRKVE